MLTVSISKLDQLGRELGSAAATILTNAKGDLGARLAHDGAVTKAIRSVENDWSKQRTAITDYLTAMGKGAKDAAALYAAIEEQISAAAIPSAITVTK